MSSELPRRPRGSGSIIQIGKKFKASIRLPGDNGEKKPRIKYFSTYAEADEWLTDTIKQNARVIHASASGAAKADTVKDLLRLWLVSKYRDSLLNGKPSEGVVRDYDSACRIHIVPHLGDIKLSKLGAHQIEAWQDIISNAVSERTGKPLSPDRKRIIWQVLTQAMKFGFHRGYLAVNPTGGLTGFKSQQSDPKRKTLSDADYKKFIKYLAEHPCDHANKYCRLRFMVGIHLGRRQGEVLAMSWDAVDLKRKVLQVDARLKSIRWQHGCPAVDGKPSCGKSSGGFCPQRKGGGLTLFEGTKGGKSNKPEIPIDSPAWTSAFREHKAAQDKERAASLKAREKAGVPLDSTDPLPKRAFWYSPKPEHTNLIFTHPDNQRAFVASSDNFRFRLLLEAAGIKTTYNIHALRHTAATRLSASTNGNLPIIKEILGHKSIQTSMLYISPDLVERQKALNKAMKDAMSTILAED
jgi:integrase